jgi:predicted metal-dependent phosphoesterase TrpH
MDIIKNRDDIIRYDLHCHTTCSDGAHSPLEVLQMAKQRGLAGLSITDHDTISAYETAVPAAKELGLDLIPGVEFSTTFREMSIHILGYDFDLLNSDIINFCQLHLERREKRALEILAKLKRLGFEINPREVLGRQIGRPHIAKMLIDLGAVKDIKEAFRKYLGENGPAYVRGNKVTVTETLELIHAAGGKAILAHPHLIRKSNVVKDLLRMDFDGLEVFYGTIQRNMEQKWLDIAIEKNWLITGGSDFHGDAVRPGIPLGCSWVDQSRVQSLKAKIR